MRYTVLFGALLCIASLAHAQSFSCPAGQEDMLNYFTMAYPNRLDTYMGPGNANPIYTTIVPDYGSKWATSGYFVWTKSAIGYPWDVKAFDGNYIYDRTTELIWTDPTSFKRFNSDLPITRRCVPMNGPGATVVVSSSGTNYSSYESCNVTETQNLGYVYNTVSAPTVVNSGGNKGNVKTRFFKYNYSCDSNYQNCQYLEVFSLGYQIGLYDWKYYELQNGKLVLMQESQINNADPGAATPYAPCVNSFNGSH